MSEKLSLEILAIRKDKELQREEIEDTHLKNNILEKGMATLVIELKKAKSMVK